MMNPLSECEEREMEAYGDGYMIGVNEMLKKIEAAMDSDNPPLARDNFMSLYGRVKSLAPTLLAGFDPIDITHEGDKLMSAVMRFREKEAENERLRKELVAANDAQLKTEADAAAMRQATTELLEMLQDKDLFGISFQHGGMNSPLESKRHKVVDRARAALRNIPIYSTDEKLKIIEICKNALCTIAGNTTLNGIQAMKIAEQALAAIRGSEAKS